MGHGNRHRLLHRACRIGRPGHTSAGSPKPAAARCDPSGTTYSVNTGSTSPNCNTPLFDDAQNKSLIYIPVYTSVTGTGASSCTTLKGVAAFVVTGYNIPGCTFTPTRTG